MVTHTTRFHPAWLVLGLALLTLFGLATAWLVPSPYIFPDEVIYLEIARHLAQGDGFLFRGEPMSFPSVLLPVLLVPSQWATDPDVAYRLAQVTSGVFMAGAAVPIYALARRFLPVTWAAGATIIAMVAPYTLYGHTVMTEGLFFLLFTGVAYATLQAILEPERRWRVLLGVLLGLAFFAKPQGMALAPVVVATFLVTEAWRRGEPPGFWRRLAGFWPAVAVFVAIVSLHVVRVAWANPGADLTALSTYLGTYSGGLAGQVVFTWGHFWTAVAAIFGALALSCGFWPMAGFGLFAGRTWRDGDPASRALVAFTLIAGALLIVLAARNVALVNPSQVIERYCFFLVPLMLVGALAGLHRAAVSWRVGVAIAVGLVGLSALFMQQAANTYVDTPSYMALYRPALTFGWPLTAVLAAGAALAHLGAIAWMAKARRWRVALGLAMAYGVALTGFSLYAQATLSRLYASERPFVDWVQAHAVADRPIVLVSDGLPYLPAVLTDVFSKQTVRVVYVKAPFADWLERPLTRGPAGEVPELTRLPDGTRVVAHQGTALDMPVLARRGEVVILEKRGVVRWRGEGLKQPS